MKYTILIPSGGNRHHFSVPENTRATRLGAAVDGFHSGAMWLNKFALKWRIEREMEKLTPEIQEVMPKQGGVLVCVGVSQFRDPVGANVQSFLSIHIAGVGTDPQAVARDYIKKPKIVQGTWGSAVRKDVFFWVEN